MKLFIQTFSFFAFVLIVNKTSAYPYPYTWQNELSNPSITCMVEDNDGFIWVGTKYGLNRYDGSSYRTFLASSMPDAIKNNYIYDLAADVDGGIWFGSKSGLYYYKDGRFSVENTNTIFNPVTKVVVQDSSHLVTIGMNGIARFDIMREGDFKYPHFTAMGDYRNGRNINDLSVSSLGDVWYSVESQNVSSIVVLDENLDYLDSLAIGRRTVTDIEADLYGQVWVGTDDGILSYDATSRKSIPLLSEVSSVTNGHKVLFIRRYDKYGVLVGIKNEGLFVVNLRYGSVQKINHEERLEYEKCICHVDTKDNIWITDGMSSFKYLITKTNYLHIPDIEGYDHIQQIDLLQNGLLAVSSDDAFFTYDPQTGRICDIVDSRNSLPVQLVDSNGFLWLADKYGTVKKYKTDDKGLKVQRSYIFKSGVNYIGAADDGAVLVFSGDNNVYKIDDDDIHNVYTIIGARSLPVADSKTDKIYISRPLGETIEYSDGSFVQSDIAINSASCILTARDSSIWYGTYNKGLVHLIPSTGERIIYDEASHIVDSDIKSLIEDNYGNIWFSTSKHITKYDISHDEFLVLYDNYIPTDGFYENGCVCKDDNGTLYFGGNCGLTIIDPANVHMSSLSDETSFILDEVLVDGEIIQSPFTDIVLKPQQRNLSLRFVALDFRQGARINYSYMLDGFDDDWNNTNSNNAVYTNLPAGKYVFRAKTRKSNGQWNDSVISIPVIVKPTFVETIWAKVSFVVIMFFLISLIIRNRTQKSRLLINAHKEKVQEEYIDFLTNVSHEFRTPLSLLYGPLEQMLQKGGYDQEDHKNLVMMHRNVSRLVELSEKSLNASAGRYSDKILKVGQHNLSSFVNEFSDVFRFAALEKDIRFELNVETGYVEAFFDREKIEKILYNLLSNAFKYTEEHGYVQLECRSNGKEVRFVVKDDGRGIPENMECQIFEQFNRLGAEGLNIKGSGIGLHYAQTLANVHKGKIVYRPNSPKGCIFELIVPCHEDAYTDLEKESVGTIISQNEIVSDIKTDSNVKEARILLVEDNEDVRIYLRSLFMDRFNISSCVNGEEGLDMAKSLVPDIIISDVMMPVMDGFELCRSIKTDPMINHIPIILLTAKADQGSSIEGLHDGAEAYITKPFVPEYLIATVDSILKNRKHIQSKILNLTPSMIKDDKIVVEVGLNPSDRKFLEKVQNTIKERLSEEKYTIDKLAIDVGMSYSSLYAKMKALTGQSPLSYINNFKMNVAKEMILSGEYKISEVGYAIGASTSSSFAKMFRQHFGISPTEMKARCSERQR